MLKIADKSGKVLFLLNDEDVAPEIVDPESVQQLKNKDEKVIDNDDEVLFEETV